MKHMRALGVGCVTAVHLHAYMAYTTGLIKPVWQLRQVNNNCGDSCLIAVNCGSRLMRCIIANSHMWQCSIGILNWNSKQFRTANASRNFNCLQPRLVVCARILTSCSPKSFVFYSLTMLSVSCGCTIKTLKLYEMPRNEMQTCYYRIVS